jgi:Kef-type K+ transport system membrane component KefB
VSEIDFSGLLIVAAVAFSAPLLLGLAPTLRLPAVVLELVAGIAIGPSGFGWVELDEPVEVLSLVGLAFLLFLAGLEIEFERLRGRLLGVAGLGFVASFGLAVLAAFALEGLGQVETPLLVAIILVATSLGVVVPVLKDAGKASSYLGQLVIAAASIADFGAVILLSLFFSREATSIWTKLVLLGGFLLLGAAFALALLGAGRSMRISDVLLRLQDTTAQIRVRGAFLLLVGFVALAESLGLEVILGAFLAGGVLSLVDRDRMMTHPAFRAKLEAVGYGVFIPVFFVASGIRFDLDALFGSTSTVARVPLFLATLLHRSRVSGPALPLDRRRPAHARGRAPTGNLATVHRRGVHDWNRARSSRPGDRCRADRCRLALRAGLPAARTHDPSSRRGPEFTPRHRGRGAAAVFLLNGNHGGYTFSSRLRSRSSQRDALRHVGDGRTDEQPAYGHRSQLRLWPDPLRRNEPRALRVHAGPAREDNVLSRMRRRLAALHRPGTATGGHGNEPLASRNDTPARRQASADLCRQAALLLRSRRARQGPLPEHPRVRRSLAGRPAQRTVGSLIRISRSRDRRSVRARPQVAPILR